MDNFHDSVSKDVHEIMGTTPFNVHAVRARGNFNSVDLDFRADFLEDFKHVCPLNVVYDAVAVFLVVDLVENRSVVNFEVISAGVVFDVCIHKDVFNGDCIRADFTLSGLVVWFLKTENLEELKEQEQHG